jgi:hypothetical protein
MKKGSPLATETKISVDLCMVGFDCILNETVFDEKNRRIETPQGVGIESFSQ